MKHIRPYLGTIVGCAVGIVTIVIWMVTFNQHSGEDYARKLFPVMCLILEWNRLYSPININIPWVVWYGGAFLHWFIIGIAVDLVRGVIRFCRRSQENRKLFGRCIALVGIGWAMLMPAFLFCQEFNDSEYKRLRELEWHFHPISKGYLGASSNALISVPKFHLEHNRAEIQALMETRYRRFNEYAVAIVSSSVCIVILSIYAFRKCKRENITT